MRPINPRVTLLFFLIFTFVLAAYSLTVGKYPISLKHIIGILNPFSNALYPLPVEQKIIILQIRLPRAILAILVGINLSICGAVLQNIFQNPLVSPYILGVSSGAALGATLVMILFESFHPLLLQGGAFLFGFIAVLIVLGIAKFFGFHNTVILILSGVVVTAFCTAFVSLLQYLSGDDRLQAILFWTMGSFINVKWPEVLTLLPFTAIGCIFFVWYSWKIMALSLGHEQATSLGVDVKKMKLFIIILSSIIIGVSVALTGPIGWVGLIIPHSARFLLGSNNSWVHGLSAAMGGGFMLGVDLIARSSFSIELPVGVVSALIGAPFFIFILLLKNKRVG